MRGWVLALLLGQGCTLPEPKDLVSRRAEARMSANQLHNLGFQHLQSGDFEQCVRINELVLTRKRMVRSAVNLGTCLYELGRFAQSEAAFEEALSWKKEPKAVLGRFMARRAQGASADESEVSQLGFANWKTMSPEARGIEELITPRRSPPGIMGD